jgi:hypothetical protein
MRDLPRTVNLAEDTVGWPFEKLRIAQHVVGNPVIHDPGDVAGIGERSIPPLVGVLLG